MHGNLYLQDNEVDLATLNSPEMVKRIIFELTGLNNSLIEYSMRGLCTKNGKLFYNYLIFCLTI